MNPVPERIANLPHDSRGYPIPWNVLRADDGTPFFTVNDTSKHYRALRVGLCPICGDRLGKWRWFVGGPLSAFDPEGWYLDLPGHHECITFALATCPYLAMPKYLGRVDVANPAKLPPAARVLIDETMIPERPEIFVTVASTRMQVFKQRPSILVRPVRPYLGVEFWRHGQRIPEHRAMPVLRGLFGPDWVLPL